MKSYKEAVRSIGIRKEHFIKWAKDNDLKIYYDWEYQTKIYNDEIRSNVINFVEFKIKDLQETLKKIKADV